MKKNFPALIALLLILASLLSCSSTVIIITPPSAGTEHTMHPVTDSGETRETSLLTHETTPLATAEISPEPGTSSAISIENSEVGRTSFLAVGDNLIHLALATIGAADEEEPDGFDFCKIYKALVPRISAADIAYINQETMLDDDKPYSNYPRFNSPEAVADDLKTVGFDIVGIGNNHTLDTGCSGAISTIDKFASIGILTVGAYKNTTDESNIRIIESNGIKISFLNYTYGSNCNYTSDNCGLILPLCDDEKMISDLKKANAVSDFTVVFVHWGVENSFTPSSEQKRVARLLADNGAGVIIGTHPHVIQPVEWIECDNGNKVLCAYSLGNFISMMAYDYNMLGGMLEFDIVKMSDGSVGVESPVVYPTVFYFNKSYADCKVMYLSDFTAEMSGSHGVGLYPKDSSVKNTIYYESLKKYYINTISEEFRISVS